MPYTACPRSECCTCACNSDDARKPCCESCERCRNAIGQQSSAFISTLNCECPCSPWPCGVMWLFLRLTSWLSAHVTWLLALKSTCVYFQLWKSYDLIWLYVHIIMAGPMSYMRPDNIPYALFYFWRSRCFRHMSCRDSLASVDDPLESIVNEKQRRWKARIANAASFATVVLRMRVSVAMIFGNIHAALIDKSELDGIVGLFYRLVWVDIFLFYISFYFAVLRQCRIFCQLGCIRFYCWFFLVILVGFVCMELPMHIMQKHIDYSWCSFFVPSKNVSACRVFACSETFHVLVKDDDDD